MTAVIDIEGDQPRLYADEYRALVAAERAEQGLPATVTDPEALTVLAAILTSGRES